MRLSNEPRRPRRSDFVVYMVLDDGRQFPMVWCNKYTDAARVIRLSRPRGRRALIIKQEDG